MFKKFLFQIRKWVAERTVVLVLCITLFRRTRMAFSATERNARYMRGGNYEIRRYLDEFQ